MNRYNKGNEAWTEAFRNSYLSEPVPGESGDGWATVSSLAARRQTRRLLGVAAALLHFIDYHPVIKVLDLTDYDRLVASGKLFCRKVVSGKSDTLVEKLRSRNG